ncbi:MAG TPA: hypothetical protein VMI92_01870 [Steroidobacteraceae bacterium]|nr:hypothetical protein [Steroidobacteraceae bacterium]
MLWLCILPPPLDAAALQRLGWWAQQWSGDISVRAAEAEAAATRSDPSLRHDVLWLEIGASLALFGGLAALLARIEAALGELDYPFRHGMAPTPAAALLRARAGCSAPCADTAALQRSWRAFRLQWLALPEATLAALAASGLTRIDQVLALPSDALARRFGPATTRALRRLQGLEAEPLPRLGLPTRYHSRCEFAAEVHDTQALRFPLQRLLGEFQGYLRARDRAVQDFTLCLEHAHHAETRLQVGTAQPERAAARLLALLALQLEKLALPEGVRALRVEARRFTAPSVLQQDLFDAAVEQQQQWHETCDRLRAALGPGALSLPRLQADHRPERAYRYAPVADAAGSDHAPVAAPRPCMLLPEPQPLAAPPQLLAGPERIESGWWSGEDATRDYFAACDARGSRLWVYFDRQRGGWYLHGLWS